MKKISLMLAMAGMVWAIQPAHAQTIDSSKNRIEVKKKVKTGVNGRKVTKIKMEGTGTQGAISGAADGTVTGKLPAPVVVTPPPAPVAPTVVLVTPEPEKPVLPTTEVTTTTETKPAPVAPASSTSTTQTTTSTHVVHSANANKGATHVYHKVYKKKPTVVSGTKTTTTTTTVKKSE
ncbi:MAG: hypothetical protein JWQ63_2953 [Mucilaginibacter sp.]|nr:hypothetical protein [Mucilaginibacter sp.]